MLIERPWATKPFVTNNESPLQMPVFNMISGKFTGRLCNLDEKIYNLPLRRDIVYRVHRYFEELHHQTTHRTKTRGDVSGSGLKMRPQKKNGKARQGDKRAPHLKKGGKAHGPVPKDYSFPINEKVRVLALKTLLSARLFEEKLVLVDTEELPFGKTRILEEIISPYMRDKILFLHGFKPDEKFVQASKNIETLTLSNPQ